MTLKICVNWIKRTKNMLVFNPLGSSHKRANIILPYSIEKMNHLVYNVWQLKLKSKKFQDVADQVF